jgi:hypothetical protein
MLTINQRTLRHIFNVPLAKNFTPNKALQADAGKTGGFLLFCSKNSIIWIEILR